MRYLHRNVLPWRSEGTYGVSRGSPSRELSNSTLRDQHGRPRSLLQTESIVCTGTGLNRFTPILQGEIHGIAHTRHDGFGHERRRVRPFVEHELVFARQHDIAVLQRMTDHVLLVDVRAIATGGIDQ